MAKPPYFQFYPRDFCSDHAVEAMDTEAIGAYILLLCKAWGETPIGTLPDDDRLLARWSRLSPERWSELRPQVVAAFTVGADSRWHQKRMRKEAEAYLSKCKKASESAKKRWDSEGNANALQTHCEGNARASVSVSKSNSVSVREKDKKKDFWEVACESLPESARTDAVRDAWIEWEQHRRESKKAVTRLSAVKQAKAMSEWEPGRIVAAIEHSIANGWQGIFEPQGNKNEQQRNQKRANEYDESELELPNMR